MTDTLYHKLLVTEDINSKLMQDIARFQKKLKDYESLPGFQPISLVNIHQIDVPQLQRNIMRGYENNPVFYDAVKGKKTIEESVEELAEINKGIKKLLPHRKNDAHNKRLDELGELVTKPEHLRTEGIMAFDNFVSGLAFVTTLAFGAAYIYHTYMNNILLPHTTIAADAQGIARDATLKRIVFPAVTSALVGPAYGMVMNLKRFEFNGARLPIAEAQYLDAKVREFYS